MTAPDGPARRSSSTRARADTQDGSRSAPAGGFALRGRTLSRERRNVPHYPCPTKRPFIACSIYPTFLPNSARARSEIAAAERGSAAVADLRRTHSRRPAHAQHVERRPRFDPAHGASRRVSAGLRMSQSRITRSDRGPRENCCPSEIPLSVRKSRRSIEGSWIEILHGIEVDIMPDGSSTSTMRHSPASTSSWHRCTIPQAMMARADRALCAGDAAPARESSRIRPTGRPRSPMATSSISTVCSSRGAKRARPWRSTVPPVTSIWTDASRGGRRPPASPSWSTATAIGRRHSGDR